jgi:DNA-binding Lrp family transcriptional regulator
MSTLDHTDARMLLELVRNPRATGVELAARLGLSRNTVQARTARWESGEALAGFERRVEPKALGYPLSAFVNIVCDQHRIDEPGGVVDELAGISEVTEVCGMTGPTDLVARVVARDADDLYRLAGQILKIPGVERTTMSLVMRELVALRTTPLLRRLAGQT